MDAGLVEAGEGAGAAGLLLPFVIVVVAGAAEAGTAWGVSPLVECAGDATARAFAAAALALETTFLAGMWGGQGRGEKRAGRGREEG